MKTEAEKRANEVWIKKNPTYKRENSISSRRNNPSRYLWRAAQARAKKKNIPFSIEVSDVVIPTCCPILKIELINHIGEGRAFDNSPSVDRIIPSLGYVKGNIQVISHKANIMKANASIEELITFAKYILEVS